MAAPTAASHVPSDAGPWLTLWNDDDQAHVVPGFVRRKHKLSAYCWCHPYVENERYDTPGVIVHNVAQ